MGHEARRRVATIGTKMGVITDMLIAQSRTQRAEQPAPIREDLKGLQKMVAQMVEIIEQMPLTAEDVRAVYKAITGRMINKTCYFCGHLKPEVEGEMRWPDGDMSKPKRFLCKDCK